MQLNHLLRGKRIASGEENSLWSIGELGSDSLLSLVHNYDDRVSLRIVS